MIIRAFLGLLEWGVGLVFGAMDKLDSLVQLPPLRINLRPLNPGAATSQVAETVQAAVNDLIARGFVLAGTYEIEELKNLRLVGLVHPSTSVRAGVWIHEKKRVVDLTTEFKDGTCLTTTDWTDPGGLPRPSYKTNKPHPGLAPSELYYCPKGLRQPFAMTG